MDQNNDEESSDDPRVKIGLASRKCDERETVRARKLEYLEQFYNEEGQLDLQIGNKSANFITRSLQNLEKFSMCHHNHRKHRAKFMCYYCYIAIGNVKKATKCPHKNRGHHSRGLCQNCYQRIYYKLVSDPSTNTEQIKQLIENDGLNDGLNDN